MQQVITNGTRLVDAVKDGKTVYGLLPVEKVLAENPDYRLVSYDEFVAAASAEQDQPVSWSPVSEDDYYEKMDCLPPAVARSYGFLLGEPQDHHAATGKPRFAAFLKLGIGETTRFLRSSRPLQVAEFLALDVSRV